MLNGCETITFPFDLGLTYSLSLADILFSVSPRCQYIVDREQTAEAMYMCFSHILHVFPWF